MKRVIIYIFFVFCLVPSCKKVPLDFNLVGEWKWIRTDLGMGGFQTPATEGYDLKLNLIQKGKYALYRNNDKIEHGRMEKTDGFFSFKRSRFSKESILDLNMIVKSTNDTIVIGDAPLGTASDTQYIYFIKN